MCQGVSIGVRPLLSPIADSLRSPLVVKGYFENPEANARDWDADGYFHTGDIAYRDGKSKLWYIVDRKKVSLHDRIICKDP